MLGVWNRWCGRRARAYKYGAFVVISVVFAPADERSRAACWSRDGPGFRSSRSLTRASSHTRVTYCTFARLGFLLRQVAWIIAHVSVGSKHAACTSHLSQAERGGHGATHSGAGTAKRSARRYPPASSGSHFSPAPWVSSRRVLVTLPTSLGSYKIFWLLLEGMAARFQILECPVPHNEAPNLT